MKKINHWDGQLEDTKIEYEVLTDLVQMNQKVDSFVPSAVSLIEYDKPDKMDYIVAASSGVLTGLLDSFWVVLSVRSHGATYLCLKRQNLH